MGLEINKVPRDKMILDTVLLLCFMNILMGNCKKEKEHVLYQRKWTSEHIKKLLQGSQFTLELRLSSDATFQPKWIEGWFGAGA